MNGFLSPKWYSVVLDMKTREAIEYEWEKIEYQGKSHEMIKLLAQEYEVDYQHLRKLLKRGWSVDDAMEICLKKVYGIGKLYEYDGNLYRSPKKLAQDYKKP